MSLFALMIIWSARVQKMRSMRTKAEKSFSKIKAEGYQRKATKSYYYAGILASEVIRKNIPGLAPITIYNHYKSFNEK